MNKIQYKNIIDCTINSNEELHINDDITIVRTILSNMGIPLPQGNYKEIIDVISTNEYMDWQVCELTEIQKNANNGIATIGLNESKIIIVTCDVLDNDTLETNTNENISTYVKTSNELSENDFSEMTFYSYNSGNAFTCNNASCISFDRLNETVSVGWSGALNVNVDSSSETCPILYWESSKPEIATVAYYNGTIYARNEGTTIITVRLANDRTKFAQCALRVRKLAIYQTATTERYTTSGDLAPDLTCGDLTENELKAMPMINWADFVGYSAEMFRESWESLGRLTSTEPLQTVFLDMVNHFMQGSGLSYTNEVLTAKAYEHKSTQSYIDAVITRLKSLLTTYNGNIFALKYAANNRDNHPLVSKLRIDNIYQPVYNTTGDTINGLTMCVDSLWGNKVSVKSYDFAGNKYKGVLTFKLYDHFGLDENDVTKYGYLAGFRSWFILQHLDSFEKEYKPFVTIIEFDVEFEGTIN